MDYFYDGQIRRYITQFMRIFIGFKYKTGGATPEEISIPVMYGDLTRQVASIIRENSENKLPTVPRMSCYMSGLDMDRSRTTDSSFVSKINIRERRYTEDPDTGERDYQNIQGGNYTIERLMPTPFMLTMKADLWTSNTDQKLQILEQILVLFNPSLEIQTTDNYIDWTSLSVVNYDALNLTSRTIPAGVDSDIDVCTMTFSMPIYISPPTKVKKLGVVKSIIANIFTESGDIQNLETLIYNASKGDTVWYSNKYRVLLFKSNNGEPYDYDLTLVNPNDAVQDLGIAEKLQKLGEPIDWNKILEEQGGYTGTSQVYFVQPNGNEMVGTFAVNTSDPTRIVVTFDQDTIQTNTLINSTVSGVSARGSVDAIIDPYNYNPITVYGGADKIPLGIRYLMLDDVNNSSNVGGWITANQDLADGSSKDAYDGPDAWKNSTPNPDLDPVIKMNSIIEWNGSSWVTIWNPATGATPTYVQNLRTGIQYRWTGEQWLKSFEGEYAPGYWGFNLNP